MPPKVPQDSVRKSSRQAELRQSARGRFSTGFAVADLRPAVVPHERQNMVSVHGVPEGDHGVAKSKENQAGREGRQVPDGSSEGGGAPRR